MTEITIFKVQRAKSRLTGVMVLTPRLMMLYICAKFHQNIWNSFNLQRGQEYIVEMGGRGGRRILRPGTHKSWSGLLKIPKAKSAGCMFFFPWDYY